MRKITALQEIPFPQIDIQDNFEFDAVCAPGTIHINFKWFSDRWHAWFTLPNGDVREAGVYPNVVTGSGHTDYGCIFVTDLASIDYNSLFLTTLYLITWE